MGEGVVVDLEVREVEGEGEVEEVQVECLVEMV